MYSIVNIRCNEEFIAEVYAISRKYGAKEVEFEVDKNGNAVIDINDASAFEEEEKIRALYDECIAVLGNSEYTLKTYVVAGDFTTNDEVITRYTYNRETGNVDIKVFDNTGKYKMGSAFFLHNIRVASEAYTS